MSWSQPKRSSAMVEVSGGNLSGHGNGRTGASAEAGTEDGATYL